MYGSDSTSNRTHVFVSAPTGVLEIVLTVDALANLNLDVQGYEMVAVGASRFRRDAILAVVKGSEYYASNPYLGPTR